MAILGVVRAFAIRSLSGIRTVALTIIAIGRAAVIHSFGRFLFIFDLFVKCSWEYREGKGSLTSRSLMVGLVGQGRIESKNSIESESEGSGADGKVRAARRQQLVM